MTIDYETGSGNVFADIRLPDAEEHLVKAKLVHKIDEIIRARNLKQAEAAEILGVKQPDISNMLRGQFRGYSIDRLMRFLVALDQDVKITVEPRRDQSRPPILQVA